MLERAAGQRRHRKDPEKIGVHQSDANELGMIGELNTHLAAVVEGKGVQDP